MSLWSDTMPYGSTSQGLLMKKLLYGESMWTHN